MLKRYFYSLGVTEKGETEMRNGMRNLPSFGSLRKWPQWCGLGKPKPGGRR